MVGKGGVGKTTTAGALALALADEGRSTHLVSTDPAHSLGDLFGVPLAPGVPTPSPCAEHLLLEELDAEGYAQRWMERARQPLLELFDRGTYLDASDVEPFLDLSLPGVDEVAGVLRLAELAEDDVGRVVVDTAPTGHTIRLLDADAVVRSWTAAFDAMAEKAAAVVGRLTRSPVSLSSDELVEELGERVRRFRERVLPDAGAVVVERPGTVVEAETRRLRNALEERSLRVALHVRVGDGGAGAPDGESRRQGPRTVRVPYRTDLEGCDGLRRWGEVPEEELRGPGARPRHTPGDAAGVLLTGAPPLLLFVGKGGVGKTTCAAATAVALARERPVTLLGTDPAGSLGDVLDVELTGGEALVASRLRVRQVDAATEFAELKARYESSVEEAFTRIGLERSAALDRRVVESLLGLAPPGIDEIFATLALLEDLEEERTVVVDAAPTGHFLRLVALPELSLDWVRELLRVLVKYRAVLGLDAFAERLLHFAKQLKRLHLTLKDPERSAAFVVIQPGPLVHAESRRLLRRLREAEVRVAAVIANRTPADAPSATFPPDAPEGAVRVRAPLLPSPPVGEEALGRFLSAWTLES